MPDNSFSTYFSASRFFHTAAIIQKLKQEIADNRQCEHHIEEDLIQPGFHDDAVNKHCDRRDNKSGKIKYVQNLLSDLSQPRFFRGKGAPLRPAARHTPY